MLWLIFPHISAASMVFIFNSNAGFSVLSSCHSTGEDQEHDTNKNTTTTVVVETTGNDFYNNERFLIEYNNNNFNTGRP